MRFSKNLLNRIIKEEIKKILYEENSEVPSNGINQLRQYAAGDKNDELETQLIHLFINYRNYLTKNPTKNKSVVSLLTKEINKIAPSHSGDQIFDMLDGKVDPQLLSFISTALKRDKRMKGFSDKLDSYEASASPEQEKRVYQVYNKQDPDPGFMRVPKDDEAYDQEDVNKDRKTLTQS